MLVLLKVDCPVDNIQTDDVYRRKEIIPCAPFDLKGRFTLEKKKDNQEKGYIESLRKIWLKKVSCAFLKLSSIKHKGNFVTYLFVSNTFPVNSVLNKKIHNSMIWFFSEEKNNNWTLHSVTCTLVIARTCMFLNNPKWFVIWKKM